MKTKTLFVCQNCGNQSPRWIGKCPACEQWNSYAEENVAGGSARATSTEITFDEKPVRLLDVLLADEKRFPVGISEFDRVLGGGIVPGSVILIAGDPGIGKSTLALQATLNLSKKGHKVLYISSEESVKQTKMRAERIGTAAAESFYIVSQVNLNEILQHVDQLKPEVVVMDSIQVIYHPDLSSSPGSVSQVRECASVLTQMAKTRGMALFVIGHVTKEGMIAGPKVLEHIVDTVLYFEGERYTSYRILRTMKNRFGSTNELGVFEMNANGLQEVVNPSEIFLSERPKDAPGSVVVPILEGTRPFLVEVQGLVSRTSFGIVRQKAQGFDPNRLALLVAVLEKRLGLNLQDKDIFLNVVGGVKVMDPAADLAVVLAVATALLDKVIPSQTVVVGEVGLASEVRSVGQIQIRLNEASRLGFKQAIVPKTNLGMPRGNKKDQMELIGVETVKEAMDWVCR